MQELLIPVILTLLGAVVGVEYGKLRNRGTFARAPEGSHFPAAADGGSAPFRNRTSTCYSAG